MSRVLFVCIQNAGRSQMSEALCERAAAGRPKVRSAGLGAGVLGEVVAALREPGIDVS